MMKAKRIMLNFLKKVFFSIFFREYNMAAENNKGIETRNKSVSKIVGLIEKSFLIENKNAINAKGGYFQDALDEAKLITENDPAKANKNNCIKIVLSFVNCKNKMLNKKNICDKTTWPINKQI